ncbi:MAG: flavin reductase family protein [Prevotella sp.]|nr:flavin reductase family protein [Prevotella sp.]
MKQYLKASALLLASVLVCGACSKNEEPKNVNAEKNGKIEVKDVAGRKNFGGDSAVITPLPAIMIATYDADENPDVMMAAWGGQCGPKHICFNLSAHKTTENIRLKQAFTVSFASKDNVKESDYFGLVSANDVSDKVTKAGFTVTKSPNVDAPIVNEYPLTLECKVVEIQEHENGGARVVGEVVNMSADERILNEDGKVDLGKLQPVVFDSSDKTYRVVGEKSVLPGEVARPYRTRK